MVYHRFMPSLHKQYREAVVEINEFFDGNTNNGKRFGKYPLQYERDVAVIHGMARGWTDNAISRKLRTGGPRPVANLRKTLTKHPRQIFDIPILHKDERPNSSTHLYTCEICGSRTTTTELKARRHVASHLFSMDIIKYYGVGV